MKSIVTLCLILFSMTHSLQAQSLQDHLFHGFGFHAGLAVFPAFVTNNPESDFDQVRSYSYGIHYQLRYNILETSDNLSVGLGIIPGIEWIGVETVNFRGGGNINLPTEASLNLGAGSTYNSSSNFGFGMKAGLDININPVIMYGKTEGDDLKIKTFYASPYAALAFRYWRNSSNSLREFFIRWDFMKNKVGKEDFNIKKPFFIRLGFAGFIGY